MTTGNDGAATRVLDELRITGYTRPVEIGHGGFAVVYRARRAAFDQDVAIKVLTNTIDEHAIGRFDRERRVLGALAQHPNIVTLYDSGTTPDGAPFLVMEFLPGGPLSEFLDKHGPLDAARVIEIAVKLCGALETAHRTGVLHRDIKPDNVLLSRYGEPVLADFGISRMQGELQTQSGVVTATLTHAPPEVLDGTKPSPQSDVYSLGSTLYALLAGRAPFVRDTDASVAALLTRLLREPPPDLRPRGVPGDLCTLLERSMAKAAKDRPRSALDFGRAFQELQRRSGSPVTPMVVEQVDGQREAEPIPPTTPMPSVQRTGARPAAAPSRPVPTQRPPGPPRHTSAHPGPPPQPASGYYGGVPPTQYSGQPFGGSPYPPPPFGGYQGYPPPVPRPPWFWPVVAAAVVLVLIAVVAVAIELGGSGSPQAGDSFQFSEGDGSGADLASLLLTSTDLASGGADMDAAPVGDIATVLWCSRPAPDAGLLDEAKRGIAPPSAAGYQVYTYLATFSPGAAQTFMTGLLDTATSCGQNSTIDPPRRITPPPGAAQAIRVTAQGRDVIWAQYGDYVVETNIAFSGAQADDSTAPEVAAKAVDKVIRGTS